MPNARERADWPSERDSAALTSPRTDTAGKPVSVDYSGLAVHPVVARVLAVTDHRRQACCEGDAATTCPWPDHCAWCGQEWPCTTAQTAPAIAAEVLRWLAANGWPNGHLTVYDAIAALADELDPPKGGSA